MKLYSLPFLLLFPFFLLRAQPPQPHDVVITEIMADPTPAVGLPNLEYIEIKNRSAVAFNLSGWKISDASGTGTVSSSYFIQPDSFVILCAGSSVAALSIFGKAIGVTGFPSLDNDGEQVVLRSPQYRVVHSLAYQASWYANEAKKEGGWSFEMIDPNHPCQGKDNWKASEDARGGTPGRLNSVQADHPDIKPPSLLHSYAADSVTLILMFDEPIDSLSGIHLSNFSLDRLAIASAITLPPLFNSVQLKLTTPMQLRTVYQVVINNVTDCSGNEIGLRNRTACGLSEPALNGDLVINEILFNPRAGSYDYAEVFNPGPKIIDLKKTFLANRDHNGSVASLKKISELPLQLYPGEFLVLTEDVANLQLNYLVRDPEDVLAFTLPSFPDDKGTVVLVNQEDQIIDELRYDQSWHFPLIADPSGVAMERIDPEAVTQNKNNWHSAASTAGYGTPGYQNSQYMQTSPASAKFQLTPSMISPDNDGRDDVALLSYQMDAPGYVTNVTVFDAKGRMVRLLVRNELLGLKGSWIWNGLNDLQGPLPTGNYIIFIELFNLQGKSQVFKKIIGLARPVQR